MVLALIRDLVAKVTMLKPQKTPLTGFLRMYQKHLYTADEPMIGLAIEIIYDYCLVYCMDAG